MTYFNATSTTESERKEYAKQAARQSDVVLDFFMKNHEKTFTPSDIHAACFSERTPITSIRRSMTVLTNKGLLEKTPETAKGIYGRAEHKWKLRRVA